MLDKMQRCALIDNDSQAMLSTITKKIEEIQIANRKQTTIANFFCQSRVFVTISFRKTLYKADICLKRTNFFSQMVSALDRFRCIKSFSEKIKTCCYKVTVQTLYRKLGEEKLDDNFLCTVCHRF